MGYEVMTLEITGIVSRHNSAQDRADDWLWADLVERIRTIAEEPKYQEINVHFSASER